MTEPPQSRDEQIYIGKEVACYTAMVGAWINTRMERNKSALSISVSAVAVLGTIATAVGVHGLAQRVSFAVAFLGFVASAGGASPSLLRGDRRRNQTRRSDSMYPFAR